MTAAAKLAALREIVDHIETHGLAEHVLSIQLSSRLRYYPHKIHVYAGSNDSAVELLSTWAASLNAHRVDAELVFGDPDSRYHLGVAGELTSGARLEVSVTTRGQETTALAAEDVSGDVPLADVVAAVAEVSR